MEKKIILLVEDDPDDEALTLRVLRKNNIQSEVVVAHDGVEAIDYLSRDIPTVVLLDLKLPKKDGHEVLRWIRGHERTRHLPVVVFTSSKEEKDLARSYGLGTNSYIQKPVDFNQFTEAVRQVGLYWLFLNEPPPTSL